MKKQFVWSPTKDQIKKTNLISFINFLNESLDLSLTTYEDLYQFSIQHKAKFWSAIWDFTKIIGTKGGIVVTNEDSFEQVHWFPEARLNYAENLLNHYTDKPAIIANNEHLSETTLTYNELYNHVSKMTQFFKEKGLQKGDRVALFVNNETSTVICVLAASALGAVCSLCSTDFGSKGAIERFSQINPKVFIFSSVAHYNGKKYSQSEKAKDIINAISSIQYVISLNEAQVLMTANTNIEIYCFDKILHMYQPQKIEFAQVSFSHPLYIVYSSGTTGVPKCIVHSHGGVLLQHKKEHILHCDIKPEDRVFYYTTCGWMMWHWLISALSSQATVMLFQGSPFYPDHLKLLSFLDRQKVSFFGTSAKYIDSLRKRTELIKEKFHFDHLRMIGSTGSPLLPENYDYIYSHWKDDVCVASLSGGTDILSCFVLGCPIKPVIAGEIQCLGLGMQMEVYDNQGRSIKNTPGELVCTAPFPSMPICFWNDPNREKYYNSYFSTYSNVWRHGDWAMITNENGCVIYGRSDSTLNPGGVRIGTAEIYRQVEHFDEIIESVVTEYYTQGDSYIVLFVKLKEPQSLTQSLIDDIKTKIKFNCSPRHVPSVVLEVLDIPKTKSGKLMELAVKNIINHKNVEHIESMQNPESLSYFQNIIPKTI